MANTIVTHPAQKLKIKHISGSHFEFVVNVKNADGTDYDFKGDGTNFDNLYFRVYDSNGNEAQIDVNYGEEVNAQPLSMFWDLSVENGKLTIRYIDYGTSFHVIPGRYKYTLSTSYAVPGNTGGAHIVWLYGDFIVEDIQPYSNFLGI